MTVLNLIKFNKSTFFYKRQPKAVFFFFSLLIPEVDDKIVLYM